MHTCAYVFTGEENYLSETETSENNLGFFYNEFTKLQTNYTYILKNQQGLPPNHTHSHQSTGSPFSTYNMDTSIFKYKHKHNQHKRNSVISIRAADKLAVHRKPSRKLLKWKLTMVIIYTFSTKCCQTKSRKRKEKKMTQRQVELSFLQFLSTALELEHSNSKSGAVNRKRPLPTGTKRSHGNTLQRNPHRHICCQCQFSNCSWLLTYSLSVSVSHTRTGPAMAYIKHTLKVK